MADTFYRVHWDGCPEFSAANAWSALWGSERGDDPSRTKCHDCDGGALLEFLGGCQVCGGEGWEDAVRGYSCTDTAEELIAYFTKHSEPSGGDAVVIFEGEQVGNGVDGEPLAVPTGAVETTTWAEFLARRTR